MVLRLAAQDPYIHDVFVMELEETLSTSTDEGKTPLSQGPEPSCHHHTKPGTLSNSPVPDSDQEEFTYHPGNFPVSLRCSTELRTKTGRLESEKYEFLTVTPEGHIYREVRAVFMWSCCDGDDVSAGCRVVSNHTLVPRPRRPRVHHTRRRSSRVRRK